MAEKKKIYKIVINGLSESIDFVKSLNSQLDELDNKLKGLSNRKIVVSGTVETKEEKKVVSGGSDNSATIGKELEIQKQLNAEKKAEAQLQAMLTEEYQKSYQKTLEIKQQMKETQQVSKDMLKGARTETGEYANTLNGLRAQLSELKKQLGQTELGTAEYDKLNDKTKELNDNILALEKSYGVFNRQVGNYPTAEIEAFRQQFAMLYTQMADLVKESNDLQRQLKDATPGTEAYEKIAERLKQVKQELTQAKDAVDNFNNSIKQTPSGTSFKIDIGGQVREFSSARTAVKELTRELQQMAAEGKTDTAEFNTLISTLGRLKTSIKNASGELNTYVGNSKKLSDTLTIMRGATGLVAIGQGLQGLFGGTNKELDESLKKFTSLTLVMNGIDQQYKAIQDKTSIWGKTLEKAWAMSNKLVESVGTMSTKIPVIGKAFEAIGNSFTNFTEKVTAIKDAISAKIELKASADGIKEAIEKTDELKKLWDELDVVSKSELLQGIQFDLDFGDLADDNMELEQILGKIEELKKTNPELAATFDNLSQQAKAAYKQLDMGGSVMMKMPKWARSAIVQNNLLGKSLIAVGSAAKVAAAGLKTLAASTIILLAVQLALEAIMKIVDVLADAFSYLSNNVKSMFGSLGAAAQQTETALDSVNTAIDRTNNELSKFNKEVDRLVKTGAINAMEALANKTKKLGEELTKAGGDFQDFIKSVDNLDKSLYRNLGASNSAWENFVGNGINSVNDFIKRWELLRKAVEAGTDEVEQGGKGWGWWKTASDAVDDFTDANKAMLQDLANNINAIDFSNPERSVREFEKLFEGDLGKARDYAWKNIDKLFPEEPWAQMLKARLDQMQGFVDQYKDLLAQTTDDSAALLKQAEKIIRDNTAAALPQGQRERQQSQNAREDEIAAARAVGYDDKTLQKVIDSINAKFDRQDRERKSSTAKAGADIAAINKQIRDNLLSIQKEGLDKELQQLKNKQADEIESAKKSGVKVKEQILAINEKYNFLIHKKELEWFEKRKQAMQKFHEEMLSMTANYAQERARTEEQAALNQINRMLDLNETYFSEKKRQYSYDTSQTGMESQKANQDLLQKQKQYHQQLLAEQKAYISDKYALQLEESGQNEKNLLAEEERQYQSQLAALEKSNQEKHQQLNEYYEQGILNEEEYMRAIEENQLSHTTASQDLWLAHQTKMNEIQKNGETERKVIQEQGNQERYDAQVEANNRNIQAIQRMYDEIAQIAEREQRKNMNRHTGLFNIAKERERLKEVLASYQRTMKELDAEYEELKRQLNNNEIDFAGFEEGKQQIDQLRKKAEDAAKDTSESLSDLFQSWSQSINDFVSQIGSQMQSMLSVYQDIQSMKLDMEEEALDKEQENLDRENDMIEKAMSKQADIVSAYKDRINDTEDNLKNARGERRQALIQSLEQQKAAYERETEVLKQQQLEKEKIEKQQQKLKDKQDKLEKKRKQQQQKANMISAIINTAMGVTQALGAYPPPASYILAAAVGALGAAQVATIASQKYADGGVIEGKSHAQGGVKVLGGRAEVEGKEFIVNKKTTGKNTELLYFVNSIKRPITIEDMESFFNSGGRFKIPARQVTRFAEGGQLGSMPELYDINLKGMMNYQQPVQDDRPIVAQIVDIASSLDNYRTIRTIAGLDN